MRKLILLSALVLLQWATVRPDSKWLTSYDEACQEARRTGKPILLLQMFGRLDEDFC